MTTLSRIFYGFCLYAVLVVPSLIVVAGLVEQVVLSVQESSETNFSNVTLPSLPIYAIAHRVLSVQGVKDAISHGANALEIDLTPWNKKEGEDGWWADHDQRADGKYRGDTASTMFNAIADQRRGGKNLTFVWFDLKSPDKCGLNATAGCSIIALRELAKDILHPVDVRVLFGFSVNGIRGAYYDWICEKAAANKYEAIGLDGSSADVEQIFKSTKCANGNKIKHIMSNGYYNYTDLPSQFGNCELDEEGNHVCKELREAVVSKAFGKVFGWTTSKDQASYVDKMLGTAGVDGLIYGKNADYDNSETFTKAFQDIRNWIDRTPGRFLAGQDDHPW